MYKVTIGEEQLPSVQEREVYRQLRTNIEFTGVENRWNKGTWVATAGGQ